jgi:hypothetical protein
MVSRQAHLDRLSIERPRFGPKLLPPTALSEREVEDVPIPRHQRRLSRSPWNVLMAVGGRLAELPPIGAKLAIASQAATTPGAIASDRPCLIATTQARTPTPAATTRVSRLNRTDRAISSGLISSGSGSSPSHSTTAATASADPNSTAITQREPSVRPTLANAQTHSADRSLTSHPSLSDLNVSVVVGGRTEAIKILTVQLQGNPSSWRLTPSHPPRERVSARHQDLGPDLLQGLLSPRDSWPSPRHGTRCPESLRQRQLSIPSQRNCESPLVIRSPTALSLRGTCLNESSDGFEKTINRLTRSSRGEHVT